jgi:hypothetical protein
MKEKDYRKGCCTGHRQGEEGEEEEAKEEEKVKKERKTYLYVKKYEVHYWRPWFGKWSLGELITVEIGVGKHRKW